MKILVADDDAISRKALVRTLSKWGFEVVTADDGQSALAILGGDDAPVLAILDWMMPEMDGVEVCRRVRAQENGAFIYVIMLTAKERTEDIVHALDFGADTYLTKPFNQVELRARIGAGERILALQGQLRAANARLQVMAMVDPLTQVANRGALLERLADELNRASRQQQAISVLMLDLDHFKRINDTYGHATGDRALIETAKALRASIRPYDLVGRYGGEEFLLAFPKTEMDSVSVIVDRILAGIRRISLASDTGEEFHITASVGACCAPGDATIDGDEVIRLADQLLYCAKRQGRDQAVIADLATARLGTPSTRLQSETDIGP